MEDTQLDDCDSNMGKVCLVSLIKVEAILSGEMEDEVKDLVNVDKSLARDVSSTRIDSEAAAKEDEEWADDSDSSSFSKTLLSERVDSKSGSSKVSFKIDQHGRLIREDQIPSELSSAQRKKIRRDNELLHKWSLMLKQWHKYSQPGNEKLKRRLRNGCPNAVRSIVYPKVMQIEEMRRDNEQIFEDLVGQPEGPFDEIIKRDLHRTNPEHVMFMSKKGSGQHALYNVLRAYSLYDEEVGYCQGMGSFVAVMLTYVTEEDAFWLLVSLMQGRFPLRETYLPNLLGLRRSFYVFEKCLMKFLPNLAKHLSLENFTSPLYSSRWFGTLCSDLPIEVTLRVWDILINEGSKIIFRIGLVILKLSQKKLKAKSFEHFNDIIKETQAKLDPDSTIQLALSFKVRQKDVDRWSEHFDQLEAETPGIM